MDADVSINTAYTPIKCLWYWLCQLRLSEMAGNSTNYMQACFPSRDTILQIVKISILNTYNCVWKPAILKCIMINITDLLLELVYQTRYWLASYILVAIACMHLNDISCVCPVLQ